MTDPHQMLDLWLEKVEDPELKRELEDLKRSGDEAAIADAFFQDLSFGTAGLRGIIGAGTNRMNVYTVGRATQGFSDYLNAHFEEPSIAIGRDSRNMGEEFVRRAAEVFAANGVKVFVYPRIEPVPALSFATRDLKCSGGVCVTASHNPAPYNGYKAYGPDGCQITTQVSKDISDAIMKVDPFSDVRSIPFDEALSDGIVAWIGEDTLERYIEAVLDQSVVLGDDSESKAALKLVYTPLNGAGIECVSKILDRVGITDVTVVPEQAEPDGDFPTCPYPNPEIREALERGIQLCEQVKPDLLLATDPDADRVGTAVKDGDEYVLLTGNEMGVLLLDYIARVKQAKGENLTDKFAVSTIVSSTMIDALADEYGFAIKRVLTGFKYIGEFIGRLEQANQADRFMFGFEESYGYLSGTHARDKDAVNAVLLICEAAAWYAKKGMTLGDAIDALYAEFGCYCCAQKSFTFVGESGMEKMEELMFDLRSQPPRAIAGLPVEGVTDYKTDDTGLPRADVLEYRLPGGSKVIIRPSGTEPKIKAYLSAVKPSVEEANAQLARMAEAAAELLA